MEDLEKQIDNQEEELEQPQEGTPQEEEREDPEPEFVLDNDGNLQWNTDEFDHLDEEDSSETEEQPEANQEEEQNTETTEEEPKYKVKVDGQEVEVTQEELLRGYMRQRDYTQKTQQLAEQRRQFEQYRPQYQQPQQVPQQNQVPQGDVLNGMAKEIAARNLGLKSTEDLSELDFDHITAVVEAKQALINQRNAMMYRQQNIDNLEAQLRAEEPKYDEIMLTINDAVQNLPVNMYNRLKQAYNQGNPEPLREFFKFMQKEYYANAIQKVEQKKGKSVPKVVPSGNTPVEQPKQNKKIDFRKLGQMSTDQKAKLLLDMGFVD